MAQTSSAVRSRSTLNPPENVVELQLWFSNDGDVLVEGYRQDEESATRLTNWISTAIQKRLAHNRLQTNSGSIYVLAGPIDKRTANSLGYPPTLIDMFYKGFPPDWKNILNKYHSTVARTNPLNASQWFEHEFANKRKSTVFSRNRQNSEETSQVLDTKQTEAQRRKSRLSSHPVAMGIPSAIVEVEDEKENSTAFPSEIVRRSPRINAISTSPAIVQASSNSKQTPTNVPKVSGEEADMSIGNLSTPKSTGKGKLKQTLLEFPPTPTPQRGRAQSVVRSQAPPTPKNATSTSANRKRSASVMPEGSKSTPKPNRGRGTPVANKSKTPQSASATDTPSCRTRSASARPTPTAKTPTPQRGRTEAKKTPTPQPSSSTAEASPKTAQDAVVGQNVITSETTTPKTSRTPPVSKKTPNQEQQNVGDAGIPGNNMDIIPVDGTSPSANPDDTLFKIPQIVKKKKGTDVKQPTDADRAQWEAKSVRLENWYINIILDNNIRQADFPMFHFIGHNPNSNETGEWHSTPIANVIEEKYFFTRSGSIYMLSGPINKRRMIERGFSQEFIISFATGFPGDWKIWLSEAAKHRRTKTEQNPIISTSDTDSVISMPSTSRIRGKSTQIVDQSMAVAIYQQPPPNARRRSSDDLNVSSHGRQIRKPQGFTEEKMLAVELYGKKRIPTKRKLVTYSESSEDSDGFVANLRKMTNKRAPFRHIVQKRRRMATDYSDDEEIEQLLEVLNNVRRQRHKLEKRVHALEDYEWSLKKELKDKEREMAKRQLYSYEDHEFDRHQSVLQSRRKEPRPSKYDEYYEEESDGDMYSDSTDTECDEGPDWRATRRPAKNNRSYVPKTKAKKQPRTKAPPRREKVQRQIDSDEEEDQLEPEVVRKLPWKAADVQKLKVALDAITVNSDEDWVKVARAVGGKWQPEEVKDAAMKKLKWQPRLFYADETVHQSEPLPEVTARPGTLAFQKQADEYARKYVRDGGEHVRQMMRETVNATKASDGEDDDLGELNSSLVEAMKTPEVRNLPKANRRKQDVMFMPTMDDTPEIRRRSSYRPPRPDDDDEPDSAQREQQQRYIHHLKKGARTYMANSSRMEMSHLERTFDDERTRQAALDRTNWELIKAREKTNRMIEAKKKKKVRDDLSDFDEENEDGCE